MVTGHHRAVWDQRGASVTQLLLWGTQGSQDGQRVPCGLWGHEAGGWTGTGWALVLTHHLSCCRPLVRFWVSSPIRSSTAPATCCSKAPPSPPMLRLQRAGGEMPRVDGGPSGPACPPHHTQGPASRSPPLAVEVLGPVGDVDVLVLLPGLLPPPLGSLARSWLSPLPAHDLRKDVLADGGPVTPAAPGGAPAPHPTPAGAAGQGLGDFKHLVLPLRYCFCLCARSSTPPQAPARAGQVLGAGVEPGRNPHSSPSSVSQAV